MTKEAWRRQDDKWIRAWTLNQRTEHTLISTPSPNYLTRHNINTHMRLGSKKSEGRGRGEEGTKGELEHQQFSTSTRAQTPPSLTREIRAFIHQNEILLLKFSQ